jgi:phage shock protein C
MFCTKCGIELREEDRFCGRCGGPTREGYAPPYGRAAARLSRPMDQKKIAGVCAGFARYLDVDVTLVRILWLAVAISTGAGFIAYLVAWILMPRDYPRAAAQCCQPASQPG